MGKGACLSSAHACREWSYRSILSCTMQGMGGVVEYPRMYSESRPLVQHPPSTMVPTSTMMYAQYRHSTVFIASLHTKRLSDYYTIIHIHILLTISLQGLDPSLTMSTLG